VADRIKPSTIVRVTTHPSDRRPNIPTAELESFARPEEKRPAIVRGEGSARARVDNTIELGRTPRVWLYSRYEDGDLRA